MATRRAHVRSVLSMGRATLIQRADGRPFVRRLLRRVDPGGFVRLPPRWSGDLDPAVADLARPIRFPQHGIGVMTIGRLPDVGTEAFARVVAAARRRRRVRVDVPPDADPSMWAGLRVLAASGAPLEVGALPDAGAAELGGDLAHQLRANASGSATRELTSVRTRRLAHDRVFGSKPDHPVSVLLASYRPADVESAIDQIRAQVGCDIQVVLGLHGEGWPDDTADLRARLPDGSRVERFGADRPLGEVLNGLVELADAELVTKWDDDDWYGRDHLADLVRAYAYSGADVVGKAAEFVRLEGADLTVRRFAVGAESYSWTLAGGTLLMSTAWLDEVGGWPELPRGVDRALLEATRRAGGRAYRTHGFQYVLRRRATSPHTWQADDRHFLAAPCERRTGLDLAFADIDA